jgi:hypothetical protein
LLSFQQFFAQLKLQNISGNNAATRQQKLAATFPSLKDGEMVSKILSFINCKKLVNVKNDIF